MQKLKWLYTCPVFYHMILCVTIIFLWVAQTVKGPCEFNYIPMKILIIFYYISCRQKMNWINIIELKRIVFLSEEQFLLCKN